jgi:hypothetical protein
MSRSPLRRIAEAQRLAWRFLQIGYAFTQQNFTHDGGKVLFSLYENAGKHNILD